jgi:hypothetical protein
MTDNTSRIENMKRQLVDVLFNLSDFEAQERYKEAVPFVHVPIELMEQLSQFTAERSQKTDWYEGVIANAIIQEHLETLEQATRYHAQACKKNRSDVPAVFQQQSWLDVREAAQKALASLYQHERYEDVLTQRFP